MEGKEIVRISTSEYASSLVLVLKKNGDLRICTDFRWLNKRTLKDAHPLLHQGDCLAALGCNCLFSTMDVTSGFYDKPVHEDDRKYSAFTTPIGLIINISFLVSVTVIYVPLIIFGLLGNTLTLLVVWLRPNMRSSAHLYLSSMAVSDLLFLLLLPLDLIEIWTDWKLGVFACKMAMFLSQCSIFCTILHITFLSLERYLVVCWPITSKTLLTRRRTRALIGCLWLAAAVSAAPFLVMMEVTIVKEVDDMGREVENEKCSLSISSVSSGLMLALLILYDLYFLVPLCILGLVFILIGQTLRLHTQISRKDKSHQHAVKMLGVIFLAFVVCWLPYIVRLTMIAAINPLVYNLMSARYRHAVRSIVQTHCLTPSH
ncbi:growth hormone secretagogue receptor type 1-like [Limanda limanda]|uniref:growth hormone secretagogue receptor type 1-like n=1 Tax=Limanda limanda TaxID=27771 RepID=UPI0029C93015|nr:growth hormone secretagogue receptor type 1-like [Limanda limanda]